MAEHVAGQPHSKHILKLPQHCRLASAGKGWTRPLPFLQEAAGYFKYLLEVLGGQLGGSPSLDVTPDCSEMLLLLCLAQAQECFFLKAQADHKNSALLARSGSGRG